MGPPRRHSEPQDRPDHDQRDTRAGAHHPPPASGLGRPGPPVHNQAARYRPVALVTAEPGDPLPRVSILANIPAARPGTTRAMMLITDSSVSNELTCAGSRSYVTDRGGRNISPRILPSLWPLRLASTSPYAKKNSGSCAAPAIVRAQLPGSGATFSDYSPAALLSMGQISPEMPHDNLSRARRGGHPAPGCQTAPTAPYPVAAAA
jgi:hypothetical protein